MNRLKNFFLISLVLFFGTNPNVLAASKSEQVNDLLRVYEVNRKVCDFPDMDDFSTPEAAYVAINRIRAGGDQSSQRRVSIKEIADQLPPTDAEKEQVAPEIAKMWLDANIIEVRIFSGIHAAVIAKINRQETPFDMQSLNLENGKWLNCGNDKFTTIEDARTRFANSCSRYRSKIDDPDAYLAPFVKFLRNKGEEPERFIIKALSKYKIVIIGETHHRPLYWAFNSSLVADPEFVKNFGTIYMELPSNDQELIDKFLYGKECDTSSVIEMLRDKLWMGWPDQPMLDFFTTVWMVNQNLEHKQQLRIVLVDMQRPWKSIQKRDDWKRYDVDRDKFMADMILADIRNHTSDKRNGLFIVGVGHTALNLKHIDGTPVRTAGWYLRENLGADAVCAVMQHRCAMTNMGQVDGRLCLGLFDSAFAAAENKSVAFPLNVGPFGKQLYDADPDVPVLSTYSDGFNAYLYLGPLETEIFSPLIAGFYTDEFVRELDRRYRIMFDKTLVEGCSLPQMDAKSFVNWMGNIWGKLRREWQKDSLGPLTAWHHGLPPDRKQSEP
jgi:hypothetical protein